MYNSWLKKLTLCCLACSGMMICLASDSLMMTKLLQRIEQLQTKESSVFPAGSFPSYRFYALNKDKGKADVNAFFTGLIAFTLRDIKSELYPSQQKVAQQIITNSIPVYNRFKNQKGRNTYNFWPTNPPQVFPNAGWLNWFNKRHALPDDLDDTGIVLMAMGANENLVREVHDTMQSYTNNDRKKVQNTFSEYRHIGAYSTWFGKNMPVDFDVCVQANVLYMVQLYNLAWTKADSASIRLIEKVITDRKHITHAAYVSPHYNKLPIILYHLSRLMSVKPIAALEQLKPQLIADAKAAFTHSNSFLDQVILATALLRWGAMPPPVPAHETNSLDALIENDSFSFFIANMASILPDPLKSWVGGLGVGKFYYHCPAYNNLLVLEYLALNKQKRLQLQ